MGYFTESSRVVMKKVLSSIVSLEHQKKIQTMRQYRLPPSREVDCCVLDERWIIGLVAKREGLRYAEILYILVGKGAPMPTFTDAPQNRM